MPRRTQFCLLTRFNRPASAHQYTLLYQNIPTKIPRQTDFWLLKCTYSRSDMPRSNTITAHQIPRRIQIDLPSRSDKSGSTRQHTLLNKNIPTINIRWQVVFSIATRLRRLWNTPRRRRWFSQSTQPIPNSTTPRNTSRKGESTYLQTPINPFSPNTWCAKSKLYLRKCFLKLIRTSAKKNLPIRPMKLNYANVHQTDSTRRHTLPNSIPPINT